MNFLAVPQPYRLSGTDQTRNRKASSPFAPFAAKEDWSPRTGGVSHSGRMVEGWIDPSFCLILLGIADNSTRSQAGWSNMVKFRPREGRFMN